MDNKVLLTIEQCRELAAIAVDRGTEIQMIRLLLEWGDAATAEVAKLRARIKSLESELKDQTQR